MCVFVCLILCLFLCLFLCVCSLVGSFVRSFVSSFVGSVVRSFVRSFVGSCVGSVVRSFVCFFRVVDSLFVPLLVHVCSFVCSFGWAGSGQPDSSVSQQTRPAKPDTRKLQFHRFIICLAISHPSFHRAGFPCGWWVSGLIADVRIELDRPFGSEGFRPQQEQQIWRLGCLDCLRMSGLSSAVFSGLDVSDPCPEGAPTEQQTRR